MRLLTDNEKVDVDIDIDGVEMAIDKILHEAITDRTSITITHERIREFVTRIILDSNATTLHQRNDDKRLDELIERKEAEFHDKLAAMKTVKDLNGISNKFKFYVLGYILIDKDE